MRHFLWTSKIAYLLSLKKLKNEPSLRLSSYFTFYLSIHMINRHVKSARIPFKFNDNTYEIKEKYLRKLAIFAPLFDENMCKSDDIFTISNYAFDPKLSVDCINFIINVVFDMIKEKPLSTIIQYCECCAKNYIDVELLLLDIVSLYDYFGFADNKYIEHIIYYILYQQYVSANIVHIHYAIDTLGNTSMNYGKWKYHLSNDFYDKVFDPAFVYVDAVRTLHQIFSNPSYKYSWYGCTIHKYHGKQLVNDTIPADLITDLMRFSKEVYDNYR